LGVNPPNTRNCHFPHRKSSSLSNKPLPAFGIGHGYCIGGGRKCQGIHAFYKISKFIFYVLGYAIERVLSMSRKGIKDFLPKKVKSQQLNLLEHFKYRGYRSICILKMGKLI